MLAIIIPYYKLTFFEKTLESLQNQTNKQFKVYIGDDASPENPDSLLENFKGEIDFIYHRFENNLGSVSLTQHWERCIGLSNNETWCIILGDDDVLSENIIASFYEIIKEVENKEINVIRFATQKINEMGIAISDVFYHPKQERAVNLLFRKTRSSMSEYIFNKKEIQRLGFKDLPLAWYSDILAVFEFSNYGNIFSINKSIVYVRISNISISGSNLKNKEKKKAKFEFYYFLIQNREEFFSEQEFKKLLYMLNKCYINNKKQYKIFIKISKMYFQKKKAKYFFTFLKQIIFLQKQRWKL